MTNAALTIGNTTYTFTSEIDPDDDDTTPARMVGWIAGPRGATAMVVQTQPGGTYVAMASPGSKIDRIPTRDFHAAFTAFIA